MENGTARAAEASEVDRWAAFRTRGPEVQELRDDEWDAIVLALAAGGLAGQKWRGARRFIGAVLWIAANRASWLELPPCYGRQRAHYVRFTRWVRDGTLGRVVSALSGSADKQAMLENLRRLYLRNSRVVRRLGTGRADPPGGQNL